MNPFDCFMGATGAVIMAVVLWLFLDALIEDIRDYFKDGES